MTAYYNEHDEFAADWLRNLIKAGLIADGEVDTRSIADVRPGDLRGFAQCHFFAGIGGWSYALRRAGWADSSPVWTGSCPCQPFSLAGAQRGFADERHLWPVWRELIRECGPAIVFGEQVASATEWLGLVRGDLEEMGYAVGALPIQAASAGADHLRDRYWFVAYADSECGQVDKDARGSADGSGAGPIAGLSSSCDGHGNVAHTDSNPSGAGRGDAGQVRSLPEAECKPEHSPALSGGGGDQYRHAADSRGRRCSGPVEGQGEQPGRAKAVWPGDSSFNLVNTARQSEREPNDEGNALAVGGQARPVSGGAGDHLEWVIGADGKARRVKSGVRLLAHGLPNRVGLLRGFGNAIDHRPAAAFIKAYMSTTLSSQPSNTEAG